MASAALGHGHGRRRRGPGPDGHRPLSTWGRADADALLAAALAGRDVTGTPTVLWDGGTFVYRVGDLVAKVYAPGATADRYEQAAVAGGVLATAGVPVVAPLDDGRLFRSAAGAVGFWPFVAAVRPPDWRDVGTLLQAVHVTDLDAVPGVDLPRWDGVVGTRWATTPYRARHDADAGLADAIDATGADLSARAALLLAEPPALVHGDPQLQNVIVGDDGPRLVDLDWLAVGPRVADTAAVVLDHRRRVLDDDAYRAFVVGYGEDPASSPGTDAVGASKDLGQVMFDLALACRRGEPVDWLAEAVGPLLV